MTFPHLFFPTVPTTQILGESAIHVEQSSALNLTCVVRADGNGDGDGDGDDANSDDDGDDDSLDDDRRRRRKRRRRRRQTKLYWYKDGKVRRDH